MSAVRTFDQRRSDTLSLLERQGSGWLATGDTTGAAHVIAVAVLWTGSALVITTRDATPTARNLDATGQGRLVFGTPQDAVMIDATVTGTRPAMGDSGETGTAFAAAMGWNPAEEGPDWRYFELRPTRIQAYRGYEELGGHVLMRDGAWRS